MSPNPRRLRALGRGLLEAAFPPVCAACGALGREPFCRLCWESVSPARYQALPGLDEAVSLWAYGGAVAAAVQRLKYQGRPELGRSLGEAMRPLFSSLPPVDLLIPVPLGDMRLIERGYNQARELARPLSLPIDTRALSRVAEAPAQATLDRAARLENLQGAFTADAARLKGKRVLLIDDVVTTGATAQACAEALRAAGAQAVALLTLAQTEDLARA